MSRRGVTLRAAWLAAMTMAACREPEGSAWETPAEAHAVPAAGESSRVPAAGSDSLEPGALRTVVRGPVEGWSGPGGRPFAVALRTRESEAGQARRFGTITRGIVLRSRAPSLTQYPCGACHQGRRVVMGDRRIGDAHMNVRADHPERLGGLCSTCHLADTVERLAVQGGPSAGLDESYRLCGQCHFAQADSWAGGAHGKRLDGWQGQRVVLACTACHDPHAPAAEHRIPFRAPELERIRQPIP